MTPRAIKDLEEAGIAPAVSVRLLCLDLARTLAPALPDAETLIEHATKFENFALNGAVQAGGTKARG
jgi:hypothetical protein